MLGIYRYILAMMVTLSHLWNDLLWWQGIYGVFGFYIISGYLMTLILSKTYVGPKNIWRYALNRALRIFPVYWVGLGLVLILIFSGFNTTFEIDIAPAPANLSDILGNFTLIWNWNTPLAISQSWSLRVELVFYIAMIFLVRNPILVAIWLILSIALCIYQAHENLIFVERYTSLAGSSIAFAIGAAIYHLRQVLQLGVHHIWSASILFIAHLIFAPEIWGFPREASGFGMLFQRHHFGLYGQILVSAYLVWALQSPDNLIQRSSRIEKIGKPLGDIAYAIFLTHWIAVIFVSGLGVSFDNKMVLVPTALILTHLISVGLFQLVERPINDRYRNRIRP